MLLIGAGVAGFAAAGLAAGGSAEGVVAGGSAPPDASHHPTPRNSRPRSALRLTSELNTVFRIDTIFFHSCPIHRLTTLFNVIGLESVCLDPSCKSHE